MSVVTNPETAPAPPPTAPTAPQAPPTPTTSQLALSSILAPSFATDTAIAGSTVTDRVTARHQNSLTAAKTYTSNMSIAGIQTLAGDYLSRTSLLNLADALRTLLMHRPAGRPTTMSATNSPHTPRTGRASVKLSEASEKVKGACVKGGKTSGKECRRRLRCLATVVPEWMTIEENVVKINWKCDYVRARKVILGEVVGEKEATRTATNTTTTTTTTTTTSSAAAAATATPGASLPRLPSQHKRPLAAPGPPPSLSDRRPDLPPPPVSKKLRVNETHRDTSSSSRYDTTTLPPIPPRTVADIGDGRTARGLKRMFLEMVKGKRL